MFAVQARALALGARRAGRPRGRLLPLRRGDQPEHVVGGAVVRRWCVAVGGCGEK